MRVAALGVVAALAGFAGVGAVLAWRLVRGGDDPVVVEELEVGLAVAVLCVLGALLLWAWRGLRFVVASRRPGAATDVRVFWGVSTAPMPLAAQCWLELGSGRWQRVMWHPVVEGVRGRVAAVVHGSDAGRLAVVVRLGGVALVPVGRLRRRRPNQLLVPWDDARLSAAHVVVPPGALATMPAPSLRARTPVTLVVVGVVAGGLLGASFGAASIVPLAVAVPAALVTGWALSGPVP